MYLLCNQCRWLYKGTSSIARLLWLCMDKERIAILLSLNRLTIHLNVDSLTGPMIFLGHKERLGKLLLQKLWFEEDVGNCLLRAVHCFCHKKMEIIDIS